MGEFGLLDWADVSAGGDWPVLLVGNGASIAVSKIFSYPSLFDVAVLNPNDRQLFEHLATTNFEEVLRGLDFAAMVQQQLGHDPAAVMARRSDISESLVAAVNAHHVPRPAVEGVKLLGIKAALGNSRSIFTTSYDLLMYWAINHPEPGGFADYFWNEDHSFDLAHVDVWADVTTVHWLHGALHIHSVGGRGAAKLVHADGALLTQFTAGGRLPLYVAEGSADQKVAKIASSDYLSFCLNKFRSDGRDLVIFGQALAASDQHLIDAISSQPHRRVAYAIYPTDQLAVNHLRGTIELALQRNDIQFFDSRTHPLGDPALAV